ncbi:MAG: DMT family transporter [Bacillota bacterium]
MTTRLGYMAVIFSSACFGFLGYFGKVGYQLGFTPLTLQIARFLLAALMLWIVALPRGLSRYQVGRRELMTLALQGIGYAMTALGYFSALRYLPASLVAIIFYIHPIITTLAAAGIFGEKITRVKIASLLLAVVGTTLVSDPRALLGGTLSLAG